MAEKEISLLQGQIERLNDKKFDLEAWKNHTQIFLERIFGKDSSKLKMIRDLNYDYSSWSLRDTAAAGKKPLLDAGTGAGRHRQARLALVHGVHVREAEVPRLRAGSRARRS